MTAPDGRAIAAMGGVYRRVDRGQDVLVHGPAAALAGAGSPTASGTPARRRATVAVWARRVEAALRCDPRPGGCT